MTLWLDKTASHVNPVEAVTCAFAERIGMTEHLAVVQHLEDD